MNILVWSSWVAHPAGGMERVALELASQLHRRGHHVVLAGAYDNAAELRAQIPADMPYSFFDIHRSRPKPYLAAARLQAGLIRQHQIDVISAHGSVFALCEVSRRQRVPMVWTIHGAQDRGYSLVERLKTLAVQRVLRAPHVHIVGVSKATAETLQQQFHKLPPARLHVIHNGMMEEAVLLALPAPVMGPPWELGFIGRLVERKRPLDLIEVALRLKGHLDYRLHVFGDGPLLPVLEAAVRQHGLADRFLLHGYWSKGSAGMVQQIQILIHPDSVEPFGGALVEAQLGARPVVAYQVGGNPEIVEHGRTGWLAPRQDYEGLAVGIRRITGPDFPLYAQAARQRAATRFTLQRMVDQYVNLMETLHVSPKKVESV